VFKFITGKPLWANILLGIGFLLLLVFIFLQSLSWITRHDQTIAVPDVTGKPFEEAKKFLEGQGFTVEIQDTVYNDTAALLSVVKQFPTPASKVKMNRTVFLTINRDAAPDIDMPDLEKMSFRAAVIALQQHGLKLGDTAYAPNIAKDAVLEQRYKGSAIKAGTKIPMGSTISLLLGRGEVGAGFNMPDLVGLTLDEARQMLQSSGLSVGHVQPSEGDGNAYVYKQFPEYLTPSGNITQTRQGQFIDLWVQAQKPVRQADSAAVRSGYQ
jgi:eukaryotic-like serine/threonine-protein kinase